MWGLQVCAISYPATLILIIFSFLVLEVIRGLRVYSSMIKYLPSTCKALDSTPNTAKKKRKVTPLSKELVIHGANITSVIYQRKFNSMPPTLHCPTKPESSKSVGCYL
jgi:hypothetical protein